MRIHVARFKMTSQLVSGSDNPMRILNTGLGILIVSSDHSTSVAAGIGSAYKETLQPALD